MGKIIHNFFLIFKYKPCLVLTAAMGVLGLDRMAAGTVSLDWNQIITGVIGLAAAYVALLTHRTRSLAVEIDRRVDVVSADLKAAKEDIDSQITQALATVLAKGLLDGAEGERKRQTIENANKAMGVKEEKEKNHE